MGEPEGNGAAPTCETCVVDILRKMSGREPKAGTKLKDLFNECNPGVISTLKTRFEECPNADDTAEFTCDSTVADVVMRVCGL
jgi:hypothetical protein